MPQCVVSVWLSRAARYFGCPSWSIAATLRLVGRWCHTFADAIYDGVTPAPGVECAGQDFVTQKGDKWYYFVNHLSVKGHWDTGLAVKGAGPRAIKGVERAIKGARWLDNGEELEVKQDGDEAAIKCTGYPYGTDYVIRVAEISF